ncbi:MAG: hypothetical protein AAF125_14045 [Chloroflexota bacterium]
MTNLPVREMVLYKHGVGFFVRAGELSGNRLLLAFRSDEINDILKSLFVIDRSEEGRVLGIHYQTPTNQTHRLATSSIKLSSNSALTDLMRDLRGRRVTMVFETQPGTHETVTGRIVGLEEQRKYHAATTRIVQEQRLPLLTEEGTLRLMDMSTLRDIVIDDEQATRDLTYFLDTATAEDDRRVIEVRLNDATHDLLASYVAPSPTWRVSYRIIAETAEDDNTGTALLQGWGLFDNRLEEDLVDVQVTLVAGQPISFIYDLYSSDIPRRKTVKDKARITAPIQYERPQRTINSGSVTMDYMEPSQERFRGSVRIGEVHGGVDSMPMPRQSAARSVQSKVESKAAGETFQYIVTTPVTVKRGESAMVPIISAEVNYERELLYNADKLPTHPVAALRFTNTTGLTLERGPITLVENNDYRGEDILPFTGDDNDIYLPYAVELGIRIVEDRGSRYEHHGFHIQNHLLVQEEYQVDEIVYKIENTTEAQRTVIIERDLGDNELYDTRPPDTETLTKKRWAVPAAVDEVTVFKISMRKIISQHHILYSMDAALLQRLIDQQHLTGNLRDDLSQLLQLTANNDSARKQVEDLSAERDDVYRKQEQLRANLGALNPTGKEAGLRDRMLGDLEVTQDRLDTIEQDMRTANQSIADIEKGIEELIATLNEKYSV